TYEHYDVLMAGSDADFERRIFRVLDREGNILALRPDITTQVARIVGTKLHDLPLPLRFYYLSNVFRFEEPQAGRQREFYQAGLELIGAPGPDADAEMVAVLIEALQQVGLRGFQINLGQMAFFRAIVAELELSPAQVEALKGAIDRKDEVGLMKSLREWEIDDGHAAALSELPHLCGGEEALERAASLAPNAGARRAIENLSQVYDLLLAQGLAEHLVIDLGEARGMDYYTGVTIEGFSPGLGFSICNGGRYDELIGLYGRPLPAVGFGLGVERVLLALEEQGEQEVDLAPCLLVAADTASMGRTALQHLRRQGMKVEVDVMARDEAGLLEYAQVRGIPWVIVAGDAERALFAPSTGSGRRTADSQRWVSWGSLEEVLHG
ncbi:MAG: ATP phosphoribosyltransferase regulatory subunit, partial [Anaerolineales bacterium]|nr:ATP phosphoribosyltransferase regulatory subunit [Anaerolineales bacterium]